MDYNRNKQKRALRTCQHTRLISRSCRNRSSAHYTTDSLCIRNIDENDKMGPNDWRSFADGSDWGHRGRSRKPLTSLTYCISKIKARHSWDCPRISGFDFGHSVARRIRKSEGKESKKKKKKRKHQEDDKEAEEPQDQAEQRQQDDIPTTRLLLLLVVHYESLYPKQKEPCRLNKKYIPNWPKKPLMIWIGHQWRSWLWKATARRRMMLSLNNLTNQYKCGWNDMP
jgi:hypothetical protein